MKSRTAFDAIPGVKGRCGGRDVFLGIAPASTLYATSFADAFDEDTGTGYQRPRDRAHSLDFKRYIHQPDASTIPLTFNLRSEMRHHWRIELTGNGSAVLYLRRGQPCLAQVDCQHRLGELGDSEIPLAFMAFVGLDLRSEMAMFTIINSKAKGLSSSLTDFHRSTLMPDLAADAPHLFLARQLNDDPRSPWFKRIRCGGTSTSGLKRRTSLRMMQHAIQRLLVQSKCLDRLSIEQVAELLVAYWRAVSSVFETAWADHRAHLISKGVGLYGLTQLLATLLSTDGVQLYSEDVFTKRLSPLRTRIDWGNEGTFRGTGGHRGAAEAHTVLKEALSL